MLEVTQLTLGDLETNCYLVWDSETLETLIIDPADDGDFISEKILELQLSPKAIILTHGHFDHVLGLLSLVLNFALPVYLHPADAFLLEKAQANALHWLKKPVDPVPSTHLPLQVNKPIRVGAYTLNVIPLPGHTPGSVGLYCKEEEILFTGDTLFAQGIGRTDFSYSNTLELNQSLQKLFALPLGTRICPGHGTISMLAAAKLYLTSNGDREI